MTQDLASTPVIGHRQVRVHWRVEAVRAGVIGGLLRQIFGGNGEESNSRFGFDHQLGAGFI